MRRLPVYLLLDTSGSMHGGPIEAVKLGVQALISSLRQDPYALETVWLSIITFSESAQQLVPLTELPAFQMPQLHASGMTAMGAALSLLAKRVEDELVKTSYEKKGDWKPLVFLMSDGISTDSLDSGLEACKAYSFGVFVACAAGPKADTNQLKKITESVVRLDNLDSDSIRAFFKWVSASVSTGSMKVEEGGKEVSDLKELPPPPKEVTVL